MRPGPGLVARHPVGRGDLVRLLEGEGLGRDLAAAVTGFVVTEASEARDQELPPAEPSPRRKEPTAVPEARPPTAAEIWRVARLQYFPEALAGANEPVLPEVVARVDALGDDELRARSLARPRVPPLAPWRRLAPALRAILSRRVASARIDERRLVDLSARLEPLSRIPRTTRRRWAHRVCVLWDRAEILAGFADDQRALIRWLWRWRGPVGLDLATVDDGGRQRSLRGRGSGVLAPGATVLALSDLGCLAPELPRCERWTALGRTLRARGVRAVALVLAPARRWTKHVGQAWRLVSWERVRPQGRGAGEPRPAGNREDDPVERLLDLLSVAVRIDTAVLRAVRRLVAGADLGVESDARYHPDVIFRSEHGIVLDPALLSARRDKFRSQPQPLRERVAAVLRRCHRSLAPCLLHEELLDAGSKAERAAALDFFARLARRVGERSAREPGFLIDSSVASLERRRDEACWDQDELAALWALAHRTADGRSFDQAPPRGLHPSRIAWALRRRDVHWWRVLQRGDVLVLSVVGSPDAPLARGHGFLSGHLPSRTGFLCLRTGDPGSARVLAASSASMEWRLPRRGRVLFESDGGVLELQSTTRPSWARRIVRRPASPTAWVTIDDLGVVPWPSWAHHLLRDEHGVVAELELARGVVMRLRWIPPGRFLMGSPEDEAGRFRDEGPQHEVELTRGFWLAATPCTQEQWQAVMGSNPSEHQGRERPVESVSWEECRQYCTELNGRFPELGMRLPTEAEWEYACRAGTTSAFNDGSPCTRPTGADPALEALGWYRKNSGNQTHPVAQKAANAWGLFDMHGNVWEWCADWWQNDYEGAGAFDPTGPPAGRARVIRGGCAWFLARYCRSAYRYWWHPGVRFSYQGFRPAAGQPVSKEEQRVQEPSIGGKEGGTTDGRRARRRWPGSGKKEKKGR